MSGYRPGGFEDNSDEDSFLLDDDYYDDGGLDDEELPGAPCLSSALPEQSDNNRGGFGLPNSQANFHQLNGIPRKPKSWEKKSRPRNQIIHQNADATSTTLNITGNVKQNGLTQKLTSCPIAVDDFKLAAMQNKADVIKDCIKSGINVDVMFASGWTALMYAVNCANPEATEALLEAGADPNFHKDLYTVLISACASSRHDEAAIVKCVELLIKNGADVNNFDRYHMSPVIYAAKEGRASLIRKLVEYKADLNKQDTRGYTALIWAVQNGKLKSVYTLMELGADVNKQSADGSRAMDFAVMNCRTEIEVILKKYTNSSKKLILTEEDMDELEKKQKAEDSSSQNVENYGDIELFLSGLHLGNMIPLFRDHHVKFPDLLRMSDADLQKLGITQFGVRKKILDAIRQTHKKEWENSSLPAVTYNKQISCAEAIAMVQNIKKHMSYVGSTIGYVGDQIKTDKNILVTAQEGVGAEQLIVHTEEAIINTKLLFEELTTLRCHLAEIKDEEEYRPPDLITLQRKSSKQKDKNTRQRWITGKRLTIVVTIAGLVLWKRDTLLQTSNAIANSIKSLLSKS